MHFINIKIANFGFESEMSAQGSHLCLNPLRLENNILGNFLKPPLYNYALYIGPFYRVTGNQKDL